MPNCLSRSPDITTTAAASYASTGKVDYQAVKKDALKWGKQGVVTGLTAGLGSAVGAAKLGTPLVQQAVRRCLLDAGVAVTGDVTTEVLNSVVPDEKALLEVDQKLEFITEFSLRRVS